MYTLLQRLDAFGKKSSYPAVEKVLSSRYDIIINPMLPSSQMFFHAAEQTLMMDDNQPQLSTTTIAKTDVCAGALFCCNKTHILSFPCRFIKIFFRRCLGCMLLFNDRLAIYSQ